MKNDMNKGIEQSRLNNITDRGLKKRIKAEHPKQYHRNCLNKEIKAEHINSITEIGLNKEIKAEYTKKYHR